MTIQEIMEKLSPSEREDLIAELHKGTEKTEDKKTPDVDILAELTALRQDVDKLKTPSNVSGIIPVITEKTKDTLGWWDTMRDAMFGEEIK